MRQRSATRHDACASRHDLACFHGTISRASTARCRVLRRHVSCASTTCATRARAPPPGVRRGARDRAYLLVPVVPDCALVSGVELEPGERSCGAALSMAAVGGCLAPVDLLGADFAGGVAWSIAAVGGCFLPAFDCAFTSPDEVASAPVALVAGDCAIWVAALSSNDAALFSCPFAWASAGSPSTNVTADSAAAIPDLFMLPSVCSVFAMAIHWAADG